MNLPNKLTLLRILLTPVFMLLLLWQFPHHYLAALLVFIFASATDLLDGRLARKHQQVTDFGKFLDPLADKMLTTAALLGFIVLNIGVGTVWVAFIVMLREFLMASLRLVAVDNGRVIAANAWGKVKTVCQMVAIIFAVFAQYVLSLPVVGGLSCYGTLCTAANFITTVFLWVSTLMAVVSGAVYLAQNGKFLTTQK